MDKTPNIDPIVLEEVRWSLLDRIKAQDFTFSSDKAIHLYKTLPLPKGLVCSMTLLESLEVFAYYTTKSIQNKYKALYGKDVYASFVPIFERDHLVLDFIIFGEFPTRTKPVFDCNRAKELLDKLFARIPKDSFFRKEGWYDPYRERLFFLEQDEKIKEELALLFEQSGISNIKNTDLFHHYMEINGGVLSLDITRPILKDNPYIVLEFSQ